MTSKPTRGFPPRLKMGFSWALASGLPCRPCPNRGRPSGLTTGVPPRSEMKAASAIEPVVGGSRGEAEPAASVPSGLRNGKGMMKTRDTGEQCPQLCKYFSAQYAAQPALSIRHTNTPLTAPCSVPPLTHTHVLRKGALYPKMTSIKGQFCSIPQSSSEGEKRTSP